MKHLLLVLASVMLLGYSTNTFAQNSQKEIIQEEKIILDDKNNESETTIEIKKGKLYVDGKKVADINDEAEIKIIKKNTFAEKHDFDFDRFDMPFNMPRRKSFGKVYRKATLGVVIENANPGATVNQVLEGSAAEKAGIKEADIIVKIDNQKIETVDDLIQKIGEYDKGDEITIELERNNKREIITASLGAQENMPMEKIEVFENLPFGNFKELFKDNDMNVFRQNADKPKLGIEIEESENGLEVLSVKPNSPAEKAGILTGDEIKTLEGSEINTILELKKEIMSNSENKEIYFGIKRKGAIKSLPVVIPKAKKRAEF